MTGGTSGPLNFFAPYARLEPNHENQLTRGLLVVLRYSPIARAAWLRMVSDTHDLAKLPVPLFVTKQRAIRYAASDAVEAES